MPHSTPPTTLSDETHAFPKKNAALFVLIMSLSTAFYLRSSQFEFIYDDYPLIVNAPVANSLSDYLAVFKERHWQGLPYYRPLARLTMVAQKSLHGNDPGPYHIFNAALMGLAGGLCFLLLSSQALRLPISFAFFGAMIFAFHPVSSCTVYPICSGRESLLPAVFTLLAMLFWLRGQPRDRRLAFGFFACALFSKEQAVVVPILFVLADVLGITSPPLTAPNQRPAWRVLLRRHAPSLVILLAYMFIRWWLFRETNEHTIALWDHPSGPLFSILYALQSIFAPFVELVYEPPKEVWLTSGRMAISLFMAGALLLVAFRQDKSVRRVVLFWVGWIGLTLLPTANVLHQEAPFAERYVLLALVGVLGIAGALAATVWKTASACRVILGVEILAVGILGVIGFERGEYYRDDIAFHTQWVRTNPASPHAQRSLGWARLERGDLNQAEWHLQEALRLDPQNAEIWNNLGNVAHRRGIRTQAEALYREALALKPDFAECHNNLGIVLGETNRMHEAESHFRKALALHPRYSAAHNGLGIVLTQKNQNEKALAHFEEAVKWDPENAQAHLNLARLLNSLGQREQARRHFEKAREIGLDVPGIQ